MPLSLLMICCDSSESPIQQETKEEICSDIKDIYCQKLFECNNIDINYCDSIASLDDRCEQSLASTEQLNICRQMMNNATCDQGVPKYCKDLQGR